MTGNGRGCVKTHHENDFRGPHHLTQPQRTQYSTFWQADFLDVELFSSFHTVWAVTGHPRSRLRFPTYHSSRAHHGPPGAARGYVRAREFARPKNNDFP